MRARRLICLTAVLICSGCGATTPQAPLGDAARLDASLSGISTACGLAYQISAFGSPPPAQLASLETSARTQVRKLASVFHHNPDWIYQWETVRRIVDDGVSMLGACGLPEAGAALARQTGR